ncbi:hypothetical protein [Ligilactobacillus pobuzihii]|uniref:Uncharacterized protein n=1 Tax=Ligilactobacillus pobuzihii TaxID=449659 RepID=A0A0R2LDF2_9LACO|nr:hypothetical protein [Ligilactobacillus pobuzihii]KRK10944.1 hypothetical protein FD11_GL001214 [Ligilactobacillus pobuzihii E100301 = KCTC 13174]KRN99489.1 hypothetical protein IV66_GL001493 [Ligilactobacillus pobuzihii]GEN48927.1 hypothetical protein LPO01_17190 [Ligilactobacillus pobuzihii]
MAKYYRVRTQEQWEWLCNKLNLSQAVIERSIAFPTVLRIENDDGLRIEIIYYGAPKNVSEVSNLMEESKMEDYITIYGKDAEQIRTTSDGQVPIVKYHEPSGRLTPIFDIADGIDIPKSLLYPKVKFTEEEKREFDDIKKHVTALYNAMVLIFEHRDECINLNNKLFYSAPPKYLNDVQRDFARAWTDESLIEVIPDKKWNVKVPHIENRFYFKHTDGGLKGSSSAYNDDYNQQFTVEELKYYGLEDESIYKRVEVEE